MSRPTFMGHCPVLDGIRGVAVLAVCGFNFHWSMLRGGFLGVDIFFVLSGFLITTLLMEEIEKSGAVAIRRFILRRILRLAPALVCMMAAILAFTFLLQDRGKAIQNAWMALASLFFVSNWLGIWDGQSAELVLGHTWSLAVEGQFYVLWALMVAGVAACSTRPRPWLKRIALSIVCGVIGWRFALWSGGAGWERLYLGTDTRLDSVFIGVLAALMRREGLESNPERQPTAPAAEKIMTALMFALSGLIVMALAFCPIQGAFPYTGGFPAVSVGVAAVMLRCLQHPCGGLASALSHPVLTWFGRISYSLYLWHLPVGSLLRAERLGKLGVPDFVTPGVQVVVSVLLAALSYTLVERPVLRWGRLRIETPTNP